MGCHLPKEGAILQEEDFSSKQNSKIALKTEVVARNQSLASQNLEHGYTPWNILDRIDTETKYISTPKEAHRGQDQQRLDALIKNSSPELGFFEVLNTIVAEKQITPGALKDIIVLSKEEGEKTLMIRVFSVKSDSINFEFFNKAELEHPIDDLLEDFCFFRSDTPRCPSLYIKKCAIQNPTPKHSYPQSKGNSIN